MAIMRGLTPIDIDLMELSNVVIYREKDKLALCWYKFLTKNDITGNTFDGFDVPVTERKKEIAIKAVNSVLA